MRRRENDVGGLAFLDMITCGFGAMVLILLLVRTGTDEPVRSEFNVEDVRAGIARQFELTTDIEQLNKSLEDFSDRRRAQVAAAAEQQVLIQKKVQELKELQAEIARLEALQRGLEATVVTRERISLQADDTTERVPEVGGIPVDSNYVIFIIDTSGSMQQIWNRVLTVVENVLSVHPSVLGIQVMSDNGAYLISAYKRRWIPDTPGRRKAVLGALASWNGFSNSSPVEGLQTALRSYGNKGKKVAIYIFGDDYSGSNFDIVIDTLDEWRARNPKAEVRVHAVGFKSQHGSNKFETLMRAVVNRNDGTLLVLPN